MPTTLQGCPIKLIVTVSPLRDSSVLFVKYREPPDGQAGWILPTTTIDEFANPDDVAKSILADQFSLEHPKLSLSHLESFVGHDGTWHLPLHYWAMLSPDDEIKLGANIAEVAWFAREEMPSAEDVAHHGWSCDIATTVWKTVLR